MVEPDPPVTIYQGTVATALIAQHPSPNKAACAATVLEEAPHALNIWQTAHSFDLVVHHTSFKLQKYRPFVFNVQTSILDPADFALVIEIFRVMLIYKYMMCLAYKFEFLHSSVRRTMIQTERPH